MDITILSELISGIGFPVSMCIILLWYMNKERETHETEVDNLAQAITNNTQVLIELKTMLSGLKGD